MAPSGPQHSEMEAGVRLGGPCSGVDGFIVGGATKQTVRTDTSAVLDVAAPEPPGAAGERAGGVG